MLTESIPVALTFPAPKPASSHILNQPTSGVGSPDAAASGASGRGAPLSAPTVEGTAWPPAMPELEDLPHSKDCAPCLAADGWSLPDVDCPCGYVGSALIAHDTYSTLVAHCPMCGAEHSVAREHDWERE